MNKRIPLIDSNIFFVSIVGIFIISMAFVACARDGRDLRVGLFGVEQVLQKKSPYDNPTDPARTIFRYAPGITILQYPFLLKAKLIAPFEFSDIIPSILLWYLIKMILLFLTCVILLKLIPSISRQESWYNLKLSILLAIPLIGYELSNSQNKLPALFFVLASLYFFEKDRLFVSGILFNIALTIYIPLVIFIIYFFLKNKKFIFSFIVSALIVFIVVPSLIFGLNFNTFLLKEWFLRTLKPFMFTNSYSTYIDLRGSSQSISSAIGRIFVIGKAGNFRYFIAPAHIHLIVKAFYALVVSFSLLAVWKQSQTFSKGLAYSILLILALILPQYCIYYSWAWTFVFYFSIFNYVSFPGIPQKEKKVLLSLAFLLFLSICLIGFDSLKHLSVIFWMTILLWSAITASLISSKSSLVEKGQ